MSQPQKINVIEYKGKLFRTQEEYAAFKKKEIRDVDEYIKMVKEYTK